MTSPVQQTARPGELGGSGEAGERGELGERVERGERGEATTPEHAAPRWRPATPADREAITAMCLALYEEDAGLGAMTPTKIGRTLDALAAEPWRGQAVVADDARGAPVAYALLIAFYSNEWGGPTCELDELYVLPAGRSRGLGSALFAQLAAGAFGAFTAITLIATPANARARGLYERSGFRVVGTTLGRAIERG
jgi:ribosomal protein S18 acetylase RimI-like enzyme